ncbi:integrase core domain protein [Ancylostoma ceylanicum]|uniref:RNA-directed DNA polymerase n=1 Tax=Ancylostoma ceylanicum TaxID=53326 RepID=A0A0D6L7Q3_9BILA|nr:integrase core domain protein [Ancylostoma ceylanicum]
MDTLELLIYILTHLADDVPAEPEEVTQQWKIEQQENLAVLPPELSGMRKFAKIHRLSTLVEKLAKKRLDDLNITSLRYWIQNILEASTIVYNGSCENFRKLQPQRKGRTTTSDRDKRRQRREEARDRILAQLRAARLSQAVKEKSEPSRSPIMSEANGINIPEIGQSIDQNQIYLACKMLGNRIDKFSGAGKKTFEEFLEEYTDLIKRFSIPHSVAKSLLPLYLTGGAKLRLQQIEDHEKLSWKELVTELAKRFKSQALLSNLRDELHNIVQGKDSVGEFAKKVFTGLRMTKEVEDENVSIPLWGTRKYLRSIYTLETGQIASFDGRKLAELRPLNYAERNIRRDLELGISPVFDEYLDAEFGKVPFNVPGSLKPGWDLQVPYFEKNRATTKTTPPPTSTTVRTTTIRTTLHLTTPQTTTLTYTYTNHTINGTCYSLTPVAVDNDTWFIVPGTQDLTRTSSTVPCPYHPIPQSTMIQKLLPPNNILNEQLRPFLFDAPPLFYRPSNYFIPKMGLYIELYIQQEQANLAMRLQKRGIIEDAITQIRSTSSSVGQSLRSLYDSTSQKLTEGVNEIEWSIIYLVLWISVPTFIILTCTAFCVIYVKLYCVRTTTSTAASTLFNIARYFAPKRRNKRKRAVNVLLTDLQPDTDKEEQLFVPRIYALRTNNASLPYLNILIGDKAITALLDSGATISYMRNSTLRSMGNHIPLTTKRTTAITANGSSIRLLGFTQLPVRIGTHTIFHQFHIAADEECPAPLLLGSDFIRALNESGLTFSMDLYQQKLKVGSNTLNLVQLNHIANVVPAKIDGLTPPICTAFLIEDNLRPMDDIYIVGSFIMRVIAYASRTLNKHEARYPAIELEALGLVFAVQKFRPYIDGAKCTVITDQAPLKALLHRKDLTGRLAKYQIVLQEFDIEIVYRPGKKNVVCDTLSRHLPAAANAITSLQPDNLDLEKVRTEQNQCGWITQYKEALKQGEDLPELLDYILLNDLLYRLPQRLQQDPQLVIPEESPIRNDIISTAHQSQMGTAHLGVTKTRAAVAKIAIWNNMTKDIMQFVTSCRQCQSRKDPSMYRLREPLYRFEITTKPWQRVHSDVIGPLPLTLDGNKYIIVFIDSFSKFIVAEPLPDQKANTTSQTFINRFVARFGLSEILVTDQGANYMSDTFRSLLRNLHITHRTSTPYHHESNGRVERANRTLQEQIAIATDQHHDQWDNVLPLIVHAYNSAENTSTKYSPHFLVHGSEPTNIFQLALHLPTKKFADADDYMKRAIKREYEDEAEYKRARQWPERSRQPYRMAMGKDRMMEKGWLAV